MSSTSKYESEEKADTPQDGDDNSSPCNVVEDCTAVYDEYATVKEDNTKFRQAIRNNKEKL